MLLSIYFQNYIHYLHRILTFGIRAMAPILSFQGLNHASRNYETPLLLELPHSYFL